MMGCRFSFHLRSIQDAHPALLAKIVDGRASLSSSVAEVMFRSVNTVAMDDDASALLDVFGRGEVGLVLDGDALVGILTKMDLVDRLTGSLQG